MSTRYSSKGASVEVSISSVFTKLAGCRKIEMAAAEVQYFDGTALDSGASTAPFEHTGMSAPTPATAELFYDPADAAHLLVSQDPTNPTYRSYKHVMPDAGSKVITFTGSCASWKPTAALGEGFLANVVINPRSVPVYPSS